MLTYALSTSACKFVAAYSNEEYTCRACYRNGQRRLVAKVESTSFGVKWGAQWHCPKCSVVHTESFYGGEKDRQRLLEQLQAHCVHVWAGTQFTCFTGTKVQIMTPASALRARVGRYIYIHKLLGILLQ